MSSQRYFLYYSHLSLAHMWMWGLFKWQCDSLPLEIPEQAWPCNCIVYIFSLKLSRRLGAQFLRKVMFPDLCQFLNWSTEKWKLDKDILNTRSNLLPLFFYHVTKVSDSRDQFWDEMCYRKTEIMQLGCPEKVVICLWICIQTYKIHGLDQLFITELAFCIEIHS